MLTFSFVMLGAPAIAAGGARILDKRGSDPTNLPALGCAMPNGWAELARRRPRFVVFGEVHGTREAPAFVGKVTCALAHRGERVLLAVEQRSTDNAALQIAWRLPHDRFENALREIGWEGRDDGVASEAMFALIVRLHALKTTGFPIAIVSFNGVRDDAQQARFAHLRGQGPHEAAQAENIGEAAAAGRYDRVLILVGNFHARKRAIGVGPDQFEPMAKRLHRYGRTLSLNMRFAAGSAWNCSAKSDASLKIGQPISSDAIHCGIHPASGDADLKRASFMRLGSFPGDNEAREYDGFFWLGPVQGSPPLTVNRSTPRALR